jgi:hypothetical protein
VSSLPLKTQARPQAIAEITARRDAAQIEAERAHGLGHRGPYARDDAPGSQ